MTAGGSVPDDLVAEAYAVARTAARAAGVSLREVHELEDCAAVRRLVDAVWSADPTNPSVTVELLRGFSHTGQYVVAADDLTRPGRPLVAASVGWLSAPPGVGLHSHVTGVLPEGRGRSLGFALKTHQRAWALERGLREITWTFDPLVRRNAWFNLAKLGARVTGYVVDFYGAMPDGVNSGDTSDRLFVSWRLEDPRVGSALAGGPRFVDVAAERAAGAVPVLADGGGVPVVTWPPGPDVRKVLAQVPQDVESLRRSEPALGRAWREGLRTVLKGALDIGWSVRGVGRDGWYVLRRERPGEGR